MQLARGRVREARAIVSAVVACDEVTVSACVKESGELKRFFVFSMVEGGKTREMPGGVHPPRRTRSNRYLQLNCRRGVMRGVNKKDDTTHELVCAVFMTVEPVLSNDMNKCEHTTSHDHIAQK